MDTLSLNICYRPLRIGWAVRAGDFDAFRRAVRLSCTLWGGRFNPIIVFDRIEEARHLANLFRVDLILPVRASSDDATSIHQRFPYLMNPLIDDSLFISDQGEPTNAQALDIYNALIYLRDTREWDDVRNKGVRLYTWPADDPLADVFLAHFGEYPPSEEIGIDYVDLLRQGAGAQEYALDPAHPIPPEIADHPTISYVARYGIRRHHSIWPGWSTPGFFVGDAANFDDLVSYWNLRAADIAVWFIEPRHLHRYAALIPALTRLAQRMVSRPRDIDPIPALWTRHEYIDEARKIFGDVRLLAYPISTESWNGLNVRPPMMYFDETTTLVAISRENGKPRLAIPLGEKPFSDDIAFHMQHLVASISIPGGLYDDDHHTFHLPFIPELNEFYARSMYLHYDRVRVESGRVGLIIDAADTDTFLDAMPVVDLVERLFDMAGFKVEPSRSGLIARQLIARLGGVQGARVFKIPGVRRLLKTHGLTDTFSKNVALQLIGGKDPDNPTATFTDYEDLYIERRPPGVKLRPHAVFSYLVDKSLFRIGVELICPECRIPSWIALDSLTQTVVCDLCGSDYDASRQLVDIEWHYRRSGVLGAERNTLGAVPVALTLQQLQTTLWGGRNEHFYSLSLDVRTKEDPKALLCELDFIWGLVRPYPRRTAIILGECKDQRRIQLKDFERDIATLRRLADAFPNERFKTFALYAKLSPFTPEEIERAQTLNDRYRQRIILLTAGELEPYHMYERAKHEFPGIDRLTGNPEGLAQATAKIYFKSD